MTAVAYIQLVNYSNKPPGEPIDSLESFPVTTETRISKIFKDPKEMIDHINTFGFSKNARVRYFKIIEIIPTLEDTV